MTGRLRANDKVHYIAQTTFTIDRRFSDLKLIGKGSYGVVCSATVSSSSSSNSGSTKKVAIKKITPMARDIDDAKHVLREIRLMRHMGKHENVISLEDLYLRESADELYIVMELLDSDLHRIIQSPQKLTNGHFRHFLFQLLCGVKYLHDNRIIHRDLKPGNLLVTRDCKLRITDFGLARERPVGKHLDPDDDIDEPMTEHVVTRWYRAPELMLCPDGLYTYAIDMWSCGCIFAEMLGRRPLFPGKNFIEQLTLIFNVIGSPRQSEISHIENAQAKKFLETQRGKRRVSFQSLFPEYPAEAIQVLETLLIFHPPDRLTCDETLMLPYFDNMPASASMIFPETSPSFEFRFEKGRPSIKQLKQLISNEVMSVKRERKQRSRPKQGPGAEETGDDSRSTATGGSVDPDDERSKASAHSERTSRTGHSISSEKTTNRQTEKASIPAQPKPRLRDSSRNTDNSRSRVTGRVPRKAPIVPQAHPPYKTSANQRPVPRGSGPSLAADYTAVRDRGYASLKDNGRAPAVRRVEESDDADDDDDEEPEAESKEIDGPENFGKPPVLPAEDFSEARNYLKSPAAKVSATSQKPSGYDSPTETDDGKVSNKNIILSSPSRLNRNACDKLSNEKYSRKAMQILKRSNDGSVSETDEPSAPQAASTAPNKAKDDNDHSESEDSNEEEDIVAKMYRLYGRSRDERVSDMVRQGKQPVPYAAPAPSQTTDRASSSGTHVHRLADPREDEFVRPSRSARVEESEDSDDASSDNVPRSRLSGRRVAAAYSETAERKTYSHNNDPPHPHPNSRNPTAAASNIAESKEESHSSQDKRAGDASHSTTSQHKLDRKGSHPHRRVPPRGRDEEPAPPKEHPHAAKKGLTVPQSPQFSKMSWQRMREAKQDRSGPKGPPVVPPSFAEQAYRRQREQQSKSRASSAPRGRPKAQGTADVDHAARRGSMGAGTSSRARYAAPTASTMGRSASSGRMGMRH